MAKAMLTILLLTLILCSSLCAQKTIGDRLHAYYDGVCKERGWKELQVNVDGLQRKLIWRAPEGGWTKGAIIALHGGGGACSNWGATIRIGRGKVAFSEQALKRGFAVFALCSTDGLAKDGKGRSIGKRWACTYIPKIKNIDLPFIDKVVDSVIPKLRPQQSSNTIYMTGISNGGFMTILYASHHPRKIRAFAPVACGDPYGTYMDMGTHPLFERKKAPGVFRDLETNIKVSERGAAYANIYRKEYPWPTRPAENTPFKQFHHRHDALCDYSLMIKARKQLRAHAFPDEGPFILREGRRAFRHHFWQYEYNKPMLDFFEKYK